MDPGWPGHNGLLQNKPRVSLTTITKLMHLDQSSVVMELNNAAGHESHNSSSHTGEVACLLPYSGDQSLGDKHE